MVGIVVLVAALAVLIGLLVWFWRIYEPIPENEGPSFAQASQLP